MRVRSRRRYLALATVAAGMALGVQAVGQVPPPDRGTALPTRGTGLITGQVVDATTNRPIGDVTVSIAGGSATATSLPTGEVIVNQNPSASATGAPRQVLTDNQGWFVFHSLPRGRYMIRANAPGHVPGGPGQNRPNGQTQPIELTADDSKIGGVTVRMWKTATITGTATDEAGEPIVGLSVTALRRTIINGLPRLSSGSTASADDRGIYRLTNLTPGDYLVGVMSSYSTTPTSTADAYAEALSTPGGLNNSEITRSLMAAGILLSGMGGYRVGDLIFQPSIFARNETPLPAPSGDGRLLIYPSTFYPSATTVSQGTVVTLVSGETRSAVDLQLKLVPSLRVSGTVSGPDGPGKNLGVRLYPIGSEAFTGVNPGLESGTAITASNGAFTFLGVVPGQYTLKVVSVPRSPSSSVPNMTMIEVSGPGGISMGLGMSNPTAMGPAPPPIPTEPTLWATTPIAVGDSDVTGVNVTLRPGVRITGRVQFEGSKPPPTADQLQRTIVSVSSPEVRSAGMPTTPVRVEADGRFNSGGFVPGAYQISGSIPTPPGGVSGWTFKSATLNGRNLTDDPLVIESEDLSDVVVTFTDRPSQLSGAVVDSAGQSSRSAEVVVFPADATGWRQGLANMRRVRAARVSQEGRYEFTMLPPGEYYVAAIDAESAGDPQDPQFLEKLIGVATRVTVGDGDRKTQDVVVKAIR